jgi:hypothetical protein
MVVQKLGSVAPATGTRRRGYESRTQVGRKVERAMSPGNAKLSESTQKVPLPKSKAVKWSRWASRKASRSALQDGRSPRGTSQ